jgi:hypothetical protein
MAVMQMSCEPAAYTPHENYFGGAATSVLALTQRTRLGLPGRRLLLQHGLLLLYLVAGDE